MCFHRQAKFVGVMFQHRLERLARCFTELRVDLGMPLVNPRQQLIEARQERRQPFGVPAFPFAGNRTAELEAIAGYLKHLIQKEGISPNDICLIYNGKSVVQLLESRLGPIMAEIGIELSVQTNRPFERHENTLIVTTSHSYKGYESEVVMIPCVDQFVTGDGQILANNLYVAMTRARSLLAIYGIRRGSTTSRQLCETIANCVESMNSTPEIEVPSSIQDDLNDILESIGTQHRKWLVDLWKRFEIRQEPITDADGNVLAEPLFWFERGESLWACFGTTSLSPDKETEYGRCGVTVLRLGTDMPNNVIQ